MQVVKTTLKIIFVSLGLFFVFSTAAHAEVIKSFDSQITVNKDASVSVVETIVYDSEGVSKHGIYRDITPKNAIGEAMKIQDISVADTLGAAYQWSQQRNNGDTRLKIGDANTTFTGEKTYVVRYTATNAISFLNDYDEIYWNVTGNAWPFGIAKVHAQVTLPGGAEATQEACYTGVKGSTEKNCTVNNGVFTASRTLVAGEGMTVAVGFPKGVVVPYVPTTKDKIMDFIGLWWPLLIPISTFIYMFSKWYSKGRDAKGRGLIVAEYDVVDNLTPLEAGMVINQKISGRDIVAQILCFATKGYISITRTEEKSFLSKKVRYTLRLEKIPEKLSLVDREIFVSLFDKQTVDITILTLGKFGTSATKTQPDMTKLTIGQEVSLGEPGQFLGLQQVVTHRLKQEMVDTGYYTKDFAPKPMFNVKSFIGFVIFFLVFLVLKATHILENIFAALFAYAQQNTIIYFIVGIPVSILIAVLFNQIMPAKTQKGALAREHLLGLKEYIKVAEKDRIDFHNAPEKNPQLFEQLLPYAIMFGLEKKWARAFASITMDAPSWYRGDTHNFAAAAFVSSLHSDFSSAFFTSMGSVGGSGGGGSSGGGGGGGGGGSW